MSRKHSRNKQRKNNTQEIFKVNDFVSIGPKKRASRYQCVGRINKEGDKGSYLIEFKNGKWGWYRTVKITLITEDEYNIYQHQATKHDQIIQSHNINKNPASDIPTNQQPDVPIKKDVPMKANVAINQTFDEEIRKQFLQTSAHKKKETQNLVSLSNIQSDIKLKEEEAKKLTKEILSKPISNNLNDRNSLLNILGNIGQKNGTNYLFYDSNKTKINKKKELKFTLNLNSFEEKQNTTSEVDTVMTIKSCIDSKKDHPIIDDFKQKLSVTHNVSINQIKIVDIFCGTINVTYVIDLPKDQIESYYNQNIKNKTKILEDNYKKQFNQYKDCKMHALLFREAFDINMFDERGNKTFGSGETFKVGPTGRAHNYIQPTGWVRFGLKVLNGKYGSDHTWLAPFQDKNNWYRCYHGTGSSNNTLGKSVDVMSWIHNGGFKYANNAAYGAGVYCSPDPKWLENQYAGTHQIVNGKKYKFMLQCAVNPCGVRIYQDKYCGNNWQGGSPWGNNSPIWVANSPNDIRPYAILIKEC